MRDKNRQAFAALMIIVFVLLACNLSIGGEQAPAVSILAPLQGSSFGVGETVQVSYHAEGGQTIARVEMTLEGTVIAVQEGGTSPSEGVFSWTPQEAGNYSLILTAFDADGAASAPAGVSVIVEDVDVSEERDDPDEPEDAEEPEETDVADGSAETKEPKEPKPEYEDAETDGMADPLEQQLVESEEVIQPLVSFYLTDGGYFDFDYASGIHGGAVIADQPDPALPEINFRNDRLTVYEKGLLGLWGEFEPTFEDCQAAAISDVDIPTRHLPVGTAVCFQTDQGNVGYFTVMDRFLDSYGDLVLGFEYLLWDASGNELPIDPALHTISGTTYPQGILGKDLDFYRNVREVDITFEAVSGTLINIAPAASTQLAVWGAEMPSYQDCADLSLSTQPVSIELEPVPEVAPVKAPTFVCYRTDEGRLGRLYLRWVYLGSLSAPLPYGDPWASADFTRVYEGDGILVEFFADTWVLSDESVSGQIPPRVAAADQSGRMVVPFREAIDFDLGTTLVDARGFAELEFLADESTGQAHLAPWHDSILQAVWGDSVPGFEDCQSANLANSVINLKAGQFVCFQTSTGRLGYYRVNDFFFDAEMYLYSSVEFFADLSYTLWDVDGQTILLHQPVHILQVPDDWLLPGGYDLDMALGAFNEDFAFEAIAQNQVQFTPASGAGLAYWGLTLPNLQDCESLSLGGESLSVEITQIQDFGIPGYQKMSIPAFFCYRTDEGRLGRLEFEGIYENTDAGLTYLLISAESWHLEGDTFGAEESVGEGAPGEHLQEPIPEVVPDEGGVIKSGEVRLPNAAAYDFVSEQIDQESFASGDLIVEYNPDTLEGCFMPFNEIGATLLGPVPDDLTSIDVSQVGGYTGGCIPIEPDFVYVFLRGASPGDYVVFRVREMDAEGVSLEYVVGVIQ